MGCHCRDDLYFMDLSISVSVHGWEVREKSLSTRPACLLTLSLYCGTPYLFPPPAPPVHNRISDFSSPRGFSNLNEWDATVDRWQHFEISYTVGYNGVIINVRTRRISKDVVGCLIPHRWHWRLRYMDNNSTRLALLGEFSYCFKLNHLNT